MPRSRNGAETGETDKSRHEWLPDRPALAFKPPEADWHYLVELALKEKYDMPLGTIASLNINFDRARPWLERNLRAFSLVIIDADLWVHDSDPTNFCQGVRQLGPRLPIMLLSSNVTTNDISGGRAPICDVILRKPLSSDRFADGLAYALAAQRAGMTRSCHKASPCLGQRASSGGDNLRGYRGADPARAGLG